MKFISIFSILLLIAGLAFAQTSRQIETDLLKSFKKIVYWDTHRINDDSLPAANNEFGRKLKYYAEKYPFTIRMTFNRLQKEGVKIVSSDNGALRIYSWDTQLGGTMRRYGSLIQYQTSKRMRSDLFIYDEKDAGAFYLKVSDVKAGNKTYYLCFSSSVLSSADYVDIITVFAIEGGNLNKAVKIIKTDEGSTESLSAEYDRSAAVNSDVKNAPQLSFDRKSKTIHLPLILENQKITGKYIDYKFNGRYFEKVK